MKETRCSGQELLVDDPEMVVIGHKNTIQYTSGVQDLEVHGNFNTVYPAHKSRFDDTILGHVDGDFCNVIGSNFTVHGRWNKVVGLKNTVEGYKCTVVGARCSHTKLP